MSAEKIGPGRLIVVVGPSGSGKDSIMRAARDALATDVDVVFPRRFITRETDLHEDHMPISREAFREAKGAGAFALSWEAHSLCYGIPREIDDMLREGLTIVLNVSRGIVPLLRERYAKLTIATVSVDPQRLAQRLSKRGRETHAEIDLRIARARQDQPTGPDVIEIDNNGSLDDATHQFLSMLAPRLLPISGDGNETCCRGLPRDLPGVS